MEQILENLKTMGVEFEYDEILDQYHYNGDYYTLGELIKKVTLQPEKQEVAIPNAKEIVEIENAINNLQSQIKNLQDKQRMMRISVLDYMKEKDIKKISFENITFSRILPTTREGIDTKALKEEMPEVWEKFKKEIYASESLRISMKGDE